MKKPSQQSVMGLILAVMTFATSYLGYDKYESSKEPANVTVNVESMPNISHDHRSTESIQAMINKTVESRMNKHIHDEGRH